MNKRMVSVLLAVALLAGLLAGCSTATGMYIGKDGTYYRDENGKNHVGFLKTDDGVLYFQDDGRMFEEGLINIDGENYYFHDGVMATGWADLGDKGVYCFDENGRAMRGEQVIDGKVYEFDADTGALLGDKPDGIQISAPPSEAPSAEPSEKPSGDPGQGNQTDPASDPPQKPEAKSAAVGPLTGDDKLDKAVKEIIDKVCDPDKDIEYNLGRVFDWMVKELKYKYITVDLSNGYTDDLVHDLAEYIVLNRRGSCEHEAALMAVFAERLGCESQVVAGQFLSDDKTEWVDHAWVIAKVGDSYYHFDPLFGRNHTGGHPRTFFMKKDADIEAVHRWDREAYPACE